MINDKDSVELSEYCFNVCEALKTVIRGRNTDDLSEPVRMALENLRRCVDLALALSTSLKQLQGYMGNRADSQEGGEHASH